jgi:hypothetical protein
MENSVMSTLATVSAFDTQGAQSGVFRSSENPRRS